MNQKALNSSLLVLSLVFLAICPFYLTSHMVIAAFSYLILAWGFSFRKKNNLWHRKFMLVGICLDTALVLALQVERNAIQTAVSFTLDPLKQLHIGSSSVAFFLYIPIVYLGWRCAQGKSSNQQRKFHKTLGMIAFFFRTLGFLFMFSLLKK